MLPKWITNLSDVDEKYRDLYKKADGADGYQLQVEDDDKDNPYKSKVDEFRTNNRKLFGEKSELEKQLEEMRTTYGGLTPEMVQATKAMAEKAQAEEEKELLKKGDIDGLVRLRTAKMQTAHEQEVTRLKTARDAATKKAEKMGDQLSAYVIDETTMNHVGRHAKPIPTATADITSRARGVFMVGEDGKLAPRPGQYGENGEPITLDEWTKSLVTEAPHLFKGSGGGNSGDGEEKDEETFKGGKDEKGRYYVDGNDPEAMGRAAEDIASGKAVVKS